MQNTLGLTDSAKESGCDGAAAESTSQLVGRPSKR